jgi:hypothetical protein
MRKFLLATPAVAILGLAAPLSVLIHLLRRGALGI